MITNELRSRFDTQFHKLMAGVPKPLQDKWDGIIEWHDARLYPTIQPAIIQELPDSARAMYVSLLNKLSRGNI